jgi:hypothetical protein
MPMKINGINAHFGPLQASSVEYFLKAFKKNYQTNEDYLYRDDDYFDAGASFARHRVPSTRSVDVKKAIDKAWLEVVSKSSMKSCNAYFSTLARKKTLKEILLEKDIVIYKIVRSSLGVGLKIPDGVAVGDCIGIDPELLFGDHPQALACTLIHELAHLAGALRDKVSYDDPKAPYAAEESLNHCGCVDCFKKDILGQHIRAGAAARQRLA